MRNTLKLAGGVFGFCILLTVEGFLLVNMWNWFIMPLTKISIGFWNALGISTTISCFISSKSSEDFENLFEFYIKQFITYLSYFALGFLIHLFV